MVTNDPRFAIFSPVKAAGLVTGGIPFRASATAASLGLAPELLGALVKLLDAAGPAPRGAAERVNELLDRVVARASLRRSREEAADPREVECPACRVTLDVAEVRRVDPDDDGLGNPQCGTCSGVRQLVVLRLPKDGGILNEPEP